MFFVVAVVVVTVVAVIVVDVVNDYHCDCYRYCYHYNQYGCFVVVDFVIVVVDVFVILVVIFAVSIIDCIRLTTSHRQRIDTKRQSSRQTDRQRANSSFVGCLLNVPATCERISGTDLLRQFYVLPR